MRFTYTKIEQATAPDGQQPPPPVTTIIAWEVYPEKIVGVGSLPSGRGCMLLCDGGHQVAVDGTWDIVVEKIRIAKEGARAPVAAATPAADQPPAAPAPAPVAKPRRDNEGEPPGGVVMFSPHAGPAIVGG